MSQERLIMELKTGPVIIELRPDLAPSHVARITELSNSGFYDGVAFHRVIPGFMAQTGDPTGTGSGGSKLPDLKAEFNAEQHVRGTCSMARTSNPNSANSQFFICFEDAPWLDRQYTVWGKVVEGMEHIDAIKQGGEHNNGSITGEPDRVVKMRVEAA
jgi:cyclophilin family peptidyl-prolyl cis-trans isomerase